MKHNTKENNENYLLFSNQYLMFILPGLRLKHIQFSPKENISNAKGAALVWFNLFMPGDLSQKSSGPGVLL